ncbi:MAG: DUF1080 domain-containing protein [Verrucomicrobiales bacterium]|nr:DUF1080 domain-containing protein [Verrucomicrobiales bacterium]
MKTFPLLALLLSFTSLAFTQDGFRPIFNGKDLSGWDGNAELWSVARSSVGAMARVNISLVRGALQRA